MYWRLFPSNPIPKPGERYFIDIVASAKMWLLDHFLMLGTSL